MMIVSNEPIVEDRVPPTSALTGTVLIGMFGGAVGIVGAPTSLAIMGR